MDILIACGSKPQRSGDLAVQLGVHKSTALRLMLTLESRDFTRRLPDGRWTIGFGLSRVGLAALESIDIRTAAHPYLVQLAERFGNTIHLAQLDSDRIVYIDKVEGHGAIRMQSKVGATAMVHTAAVAKAILAYQDPAEVDELVQTIDFLRFTPRTILTAESFRLGLEETRQRGWASDQGEFEEYLNCVAAPVFDLHGDAIASISITAGSGMTAWPELQTLVPELVRIANTVSAEIGGVVPVQTPLR